MDLFKGRHFGQEIIVLCVRWYLRYKLSSRDLVQMMAERGIALTHTTILRWVQRFVSEFEKRWSQYSRPVGKSWRCDTFGTSFPFVESASYRIDKVWKSSTPAASTNFK